MAVRANTGPDWPGNAAGGAHSLRPRAYRGAGLTCGAAELRRSPGRVHGLVLADPREPIACRVRPRVPCLTQLVLAGILVAMVVAMFGALAERRESEQRTVPQSTMVVQVEHGESLWKVARRVAPDSDPGAVVSRIRELNGLSNSSVYAGQVLRVPDGSVGAASSGDSGVSR